MKDAEIAKAVGVSEATVYNTRRRSDVPETREIMLRGMLWAAR